MTRDEATRIVVKMAQNRDETSSEGEALRIVLRELKDQRIVGLRMEGAIHDLVKKLDEAEEKVRQQDLFKERR